MGEALWPETGPWLRDTAQPVVDLDALALMFAPPALYGEFYPWQGASLPGPAAGTSGSRPGLGPAFRRAVAAAIADAEVIGVSFSGGMDSFAVLTEACRQARGRRVVAFTIDLLDDQGHSAAETAAELIDRAGGGCELHVVETTARAEPAWSPTGPRLDALPQLNAAVAVRAAAAGCQVLLSGDGADEVLEVPRFATGGLLATGRLRAAGRYLVDRGRGSALVDEAAALLSAALPTRAAARVYWAATWQDTLGSPVPAVVTDRFREHLAAWSAQWLAQHRAQHRAWHRRRSWAAMFTHDAIWPHAALQPAGPIPEISPFLDPEVLAAATTLTPGARYDPRLPTAYQRAKAAVVSLIDPTLRPALPPAKQYFHTALSDLVEPCQPQLLTAAGLIDPSQLDTADTAVSMTLTATERWLRAALARGAHLPGDTP